MQNTWAIDSTRAQDHTNAARYLTFFTGGQMMAISAADVVQIVNIQEITPVPNAPAYVKGVINLRGDVLPVIDIRLRLGHPEAPYNEHTCIIVVQIRAGAFGFIVDMVDEVRDIAGERISPPPKLGRISANDYLKGIGRLMDEHSKRERMVLLLDAAQLLGASQIAALSQAAAQN